MRGVNWFLGIAGVLVILPGTLWLGVCFVFLFGPRFPSAAERAYDGLRPGMAAADVRRAMGPDGTEVTGESVPSPITGAPPRHDRILLWRTPNAWLWVWFDRGVLVAKYLLVNEL